MKYTEQDHTFVIMAYKESPYLGECVRSIMEQEVRGKVMISTSTPNDHIRSTAQKYGLEIRVNTGDSGIAQDWNFAYNQADTKLVTLCHQDDVYDKSYGKKALEACNEKKKPLIFFTDYYEIRNGKVEKENRLLNVTRKLLWPLTKRSFQQIRWIRRRVLSLGNPVCCPSVTYVKENLPSPVFRVGFKSNVDWEAWEKLSRRKGSFIYCKQALTMHRIHEESTTTEIIGENLRTKEDLAMFQKFWPDWIARKINARYSKSEESNKV